MNFLYYIFNRIKKHFKLIYKNGDWGLGNIKKIINNTKYSSLLILNFILDNFR
jgi:hypothetical protein